MNEWQDPVLVARDIHRTYGEGDGAVTVLKGAELSVRKGERIAIVGPSGSGKSSLLHVLGGLDKPERGEVLVNGESMLSASSDGQAALRNRYMGFVYQMHHLLPEFSALENTAMPLRLAGRSKRVAQASATDLLAQVGLAERAHHLPAQLSGGERQRVAVARALVAQPAVVLADEPTGNLDRATAEQVMEVLVELSRQHQTAFVVVTHDNAMLGHFDHVLELQDGVLSAR